MLFSKSKLKGPIGRVVPFAVFLFLFSAFLEVFILGIPYYTVWGFGGFFILLGCIDFKRTRLFTYLFLGILIGTSTWHSIASFYDLYHILNPTIFSRWTYMMNVLLVGFFILSTSSVWYTQEKLETNARKLFKLAAEHVSETSNGFTSRPYSAGKIHYSREEILGFARFMNSQRIARSVLQKNGIVLTFSMGISPLKNPDLDKISYVTFDFRGNFSIHISEYDYRRYKEQLTFDQLCASLADVFERFTEFYTKGLESRIVNELKGIR
jgi:hypothetical protein